MQKLATVIIPTFNAMPYLDSLVSSIEKMESHASFNWYFVDSSSTDGTVEYLRSHGFNNVFKIDGQKFDHGGTRTQIAKMSKDEIIVFMTQDALPKEVSSIVSLFSVFNNPLIGAAYGRQISYEQENLFGKHLRKFNYPVNSKVVSIQDKGSMGIKTAFLSNSFSAYRKSAMDKINWFKDGLILGEDLYAGAKLLQIGYKLAYVSDAQVYHSHSYTILEEFKRYFDIGVFHTMEAWILDEFGKPEGEGIRYIRSEFSYLITHNAYHLIPSFAIRNCMKLLGYKLGKSYRLLPRSLVVKLSMHWRWWNKYHKNNPLRLNK